MVHVGSLLTLIGAVILLVGVLLLPTPKVSCVGTLPGDIEIKKDNYKIYIPIATSVVVSIVLSAILWIIRYFSKR